MEILRKNQKEIITVIEVKNTFDGFISRLDIAEENFWVRGYTNRILKHQKAKRIETVKHSRKYIKIVKKSEKGVTYS